MFKWLFAVPPAVGSRWYISMFGPFHGNIVVVKAVTSGYVEYEYEGEHWSQSTSIRAFRYTYREILNDMEDINS